MPLHYSGRQNCNMKIGAYDRGMLAPRLAKRFDWYYGWIIALTSGLLLFVAFGIRLSFSVFFVALIDEFGWSRADTSLIFTTTMIVFAAGSTAVGASIDRWGNRPVFMVGAVVLATGLALSTAVRTLGQLTFTYGVVAGLGITILGLSMHASLIARWFRTRMGAAIGIAFAGTGLGAFVMTPLVEWIIRTATWRAAYWVLAGLMLAMVPLIALLIAESPKQLGVERERGETAVSQNQHNQKSVWTPARLIKSPAFWLIMLAGLFNLAPVRMLTVHQLAMMADAGIDTEIGARAVGLGGMITAVTFILSGILSDRIGRAATYAIGGSCLIGAIVLIGLLDSVQTGWLIWLYAILLGLGEGSRASLVSATVGDLFMGKTVGAINGTVGAAYGLGAAFMPWLAGVLFDQSGSYDVALWVAGGGVVTAVIALALAEKLEVRARARGKAGV